jgi:proteasome assembly chaperone (PAC2) family protein
MGNVAVLAAGYLIQRLGMTQVGEIPPAGRFDVEAVHVSQGVVQPPRVPRSILYQVPAEQLSPAGPRLTVFLGERQPMHGSYAFAGELIARAKELGAERVVTFASMASQVHPTAQPRAFGAATSADQADLLRRAEVQPLAEGQIGGLNGLLIGVAAQRGLPGMCLMGEIPFYAAGVFNPKAAKTVLDAFSVLSGVELDLSELDPHIAAMEPVMMKLLEQIEAQHGGVPGLQAEMPEPEVSMPEATEPKPRSPRLDLPTRERIETLFADARRDRSKAVALKQELDRLGVYPQYEDRFLDLFRRAE